MAGKLPSSGSITMNMINTYAGFTSGSEVSLNDALARLFAGKLTTDSQIAMSDLRGNGVDFTLDLASPFGNGVVTPNLLLSSYFDAAQLPTGNQFFVTATCTGTSWAPDNSNPTVTFVKGTAANFVFTKSYRKSYNMAIYYDGANTVFGLGGYSGDPTEFPNGTITLTRVRIIL